MPRLDLPNAVTLLRLPIAALIWVRPGSSTWLTALIGAAFVTDLADGWLARRIAARGGRNEADAGRDLGVWLDPACDKALVFSLAVAALVVRSQPWWLLALILTRDFLVVLLLAVRTAIPKLRSRPREYRARLLGKVTTAAQFGTFLALLFAPSWFGIAAYATAALGLAAVVDYAAHEVRLANQEQR